MPRRFGEGGGRQVATSRSAAPRRDTAARYYVYHGRSYAPFRVARYSYPAGLSYHRYARGGRLPAVFLVADNIIADFADYGLLPPPPGYEWVRYGPDLLLVDDDTGLVANGAYGAFEESDDPGAGSPFDVNANAAEPEGPPRPTAAEDAGRSAETEAPVPGPSSGRRLTLMQRNVPSALATSCVRIERTGGGGYPLFHNECPYTVMTAFCSGHQCEVSDGEKVTGGGASLQIGSGRRENMYEKLNANIRFVACRGQGEYLPFLLPGGMRGACVK